jgi:hypothetical protein
LAVFANNCQKGLQSGRVLLLANSNEAQIEYIHKQESGATSTRSACDRQACSEETTTGNIPGVNGLINGLLHPDSAQRPTFTQALQNPIFTCPGVGSKAARDLLIAINSGDQAEIDLAKAALDRTALPPQRPLPPPPGQQPGVGLNT